VNLGEVISALLHLSRAGRRRRILPHGLPPGQTVHDCFQQRRDDGTRGKLNEKLRIEIRAQVGKDPGPCGAIPDSQPAKAGQERDERG
jgi:putative transposase